MSESNGTENCSTAYVVDRGDGDPSFKARRQSGKLSYLVYPEFDDDPHPALLRSIGANLRTRQIDGTDYAQGTNPPACAKRRLPGRRPSPASQVRQAHGSRGEAWLARQSERRRNPRWMGAETGGARVLPEGAPAREEQRREASRQ